MAKLAQLQPFDRSSAADQDARLPRLRTRFYAFLSYSHKDKELADWLHSPVRAAFVSFFVGTLLLLVAAALVFKPLPSWGRVGHAPSASPPAL